MYLFALPNELLFNVAESIDGLRGLDAFARTNRRLYCVVSSTLFMYDNQGAALRWAAMQGLERTARMSLAEGGMVDTTYFSQVLRIPTPRIAEQDP